MQSSYASPQSSSSMILQSMRKHPFTQLLQGEEITYSVLCKKQQTFLFGNDRFLVLKGIESISYAREFPQHQKLPFTHPAQLPPPKATFPLSEIQHFNNDQQLLTIQFSGDKKIRWEFVCPSKVCALEWRQKLDKAIQTLGEFTLSGFATYQDFIRNKEMMAQQRYNQQTNQTNSLLGFNDNISMQSENQSRTRNLSATSNRMQPYSMIQPNSTLNTTQNNTFQLQAAQLARQGTEHSSLIPVTNIDKALVTAVHQEHILPVSIGQAFPQQKLTPQKQQSEKKNQLSYSPSSIFNSGQKGKTHNESSHHFSPIDSYKEIDRPTTILFQGSKVAKMEDLASNNDKIYRSISQLSYSQKERLKAQISNLRRNWVEQQLAGEQIVSLVIDFRNYVQRITEIIINQLHILKQLRMYPCHEQTKEHAVYLHEDLHLQIYYYSEEHLIEKNPRYKDAVIEFKNLDYLLGVTRNQSIIKVPLMMLFEYKGFLGMAKVRVDSNGQSSNKELYNLIDRKEFQIETKISAEILLDERNCKIVRYEGKTSLSKMVNQGSKAYYVQKLSQFLPAQQANNNKIKLLRPQFIQDEELDDILFRDQSKQVKPQRVNELIQRKIDNLVSILENQKEYFTNSKQLSDIVHYFGLNMRHIGQIFKKVKQHWLKKLIKDDIIARCLKNYFRFDVQNIVKQNLDKENDKQRQEYRERNRVVSFFNIIFGNTETTFRIWRNINSFAQQTFHVKIWENQFSDINVTYLLQAVQKHLKIVLSHSIHDRNPFKNMNTFQPRDFLRFEFDSTIYNLQFSDIFEEIHECLDDQTFDSFHILCQVLTKQTPSKLTYFEVLKDHPINQKIQEFLLEFTSPHDNQQLYNKIQGSPLPCRLIYECKLAEIKWYLKSGKHEEANRPINFMQAHLRKWFGEVHPLFTSLNRLLAEYFLQQQLFYGTAIKYAQASLDIQQSLFGGDCQQLWKDYFLIGKIHFLNNHLQDSLSFLTKAKNLVNVEGLTDFQVYGDLCLMLSKCYFGARYFQQSYSTSKQLYKLIRNQRDQRSLTYILEAVSMIKQLLDINQEHESFERFVENDFSEIASAFADHPNLMSTCIKIITISNLKNVLLKNSKNRTKLLNIIDTISKITQSAHSCIAFLKSKMTEGAFPKNYQQSLKDIDSVIEQIQQNQMLQRWRSFNKMANDAILDKISGSSINRVFEFMAFLTAIFNLLGTEVLSELFIMQK